MKRTDLTVGVEYAVYLAPTRYGSYGWHRTPKRATLVALDGTVVQRTMQVVKEDGSEYTREVTKSGILVELAEPYTIQWDSHTCVGYGDNSRKLVEERSEKVDHQVTRWALKNAGCFRSTWAEYEAEMKDDALAVVESARRREAEDTRIIAEAPAKYWQLLGFVADAQDRGYTVTMSGTLPLTGRAANYDEAVRRITVSKDGQKNMYLEVRWHAHESGLWFLDAKVELDLDGLVAWAEPSSKLTERKDTL